MSAGLTKLTGSLACACAVLLCATNLRAQVPIGADTLSVTAVADSQKVLRTLDSLVIVNKKDGAAWHRRGMVAWVLYIRAEAAPSIKELDAMSLRRLADTSLVIAADLLPGNIIYQLDAGELLRSATDLGPRLRGVKYLERGYDMAKRGGDSALHARGALAIGRLRWLSYEVNVNMIVRPAPVDLGDADGLSRNKINARMLPPGPAGPGTPCDDLAPALDQGPTMLVSGRASAMLLHRQVKDCLGMSRADAGGDYAKAEVFFREAALFAPRDPRPFRHLAMLLADKNRWRELASLARDRTNRIASDAWAWLTLALGQYRAGEAGIAGESFEKGLQRLDGRERGRMFAFARLMGRMDSLQFVRNDSASRAERERAFWAMTDPLWSRTGNDTRTEFLARVTYAELRWTVEERGVRGADSDRGEIYIRYGPPAGVFALSACSFAVDALGCSNGGTPGEGRPALDAALRPPNSYIVTFWDYDRNLAVIFWQAPSYGTAHYPRQDEGHIAEIVESRPVSFDNIAAEKILELPTQLVRFRASADSVDLLVAMHAPVDTIKAASGLDSPARVDLWLIPRDVATAKEFRDSATVRGSGVGRWIRRLSSNDYFYRLEATADGSMTAARAMGWITAGRDTSSGFATHGFGMSDLLLASEARANKPEPARWMDFSVAPALNAVPRTSSLQLIWENYELAERDGRASYAIEITFERERGRATGNLAVDVISSVANAIGIDKVGDRVTYKFARNAAHAPVVVDLMSLSLRETPQGQYRVTVQVTDKNSGRTTRASSIFVVGQ